MTAEEGLARLSYMIGPVHYTVDAERGVYIVEEPPLPKKFEDVIEHLIVKLSERTGRLEYSDVAEELKRVVEEYELRLSSAEFDALVYHVLKELSPWKELYPIIIDDRVEEVSAVAGKHARIIHRLVVVRDYLESNVSVPDEPVFRRRLQELAARAGTMVSPAFPIAEAELEGHRVTIVLGDVANASTLAVRKQPEVMPSLEELVESGVISREAADYLLEVLRARGMVFIIGGQGVGKTTLLNALMEKLPRDWKLVAIEDVPELRPRHPHYISLRVRRPRSLAADRGLEVGYSDLIRVALRLRGQFTAVTEARGPEVRYLFEAAALGSASAATFHARDWRELRLRLRQLGVTDDMLGLLWTVVVMDRVRVVEGVYARRVVAIYEVLPTGDERLVFSYDYGRDVLVRVAEPQRLAMQRPGMGEEAA